MSHSQHRRFLDRGRKAGLNTADLYRALSARPPVAGDGPTGQPDSNGYVGTVTSTGQRTYAPQPRRSSDADV